MKKILLFLSFLLMSIGVWGADAKSILNFTAACGGSGTADDGAVWVVTSDGTESTFDNTKGIHYGTYSAQVKYITLSTSDITGTISKVVVNASTASSVSATVSVTVGGNAFGGDAQSLTTSAADYTFNGSASGEIIVTITKPSKVIKALYCKSIVVTYTTGDINVTGVSIIDTLKLIEGNSEAITPTITPSNATNKNVTWGSLNTSIASVSEGEVHAISEGTTKVWVKTEDGNKTDTCVVIVSPIPPAPAIDVAVWDTNAVYLNIENFDAISASIEGHGGNNIADDLFFSKYFEGEGNIKLFAIYNGTKYDRVLENYKVVIYNYNNKDNVHTSDSNNDTITFTNTDTIYSGQEIIFYSTDNTTQAIQDCSQHFFDSINNLPYSKTIKWVERNDIRTAISGNDNLQLIKNSILIDIFGAIEAPIGKSSCTGHAEYSWGGTVKNMDYGKTEQDFKSDVWKNKDLYGINVEDSIINIYTARCILYRNIITSGYSAVLNNTNSFATLTPKEWSGRYICVSGAVTGNATCNSYSDIGTFDYNEHYSSTSDLQELELDGTSKIEIENLSSHSCDELKITLYDENNSSTGITTHIPIMIYNDSMSSDIASNCDVVIMHGATLTIDNNDLTSNNVTVYPGSRLDIPSGKRYTVNSLTLRRDNDSVPYLSYKGTLNIENEMFFEMRTDGSDWRWLTLPDTFDISVIDGNIYDINDNKGGILINEYDGEYRSLHGRGGWKESLPNRKFKPGEGLNIGAWIPTSDTEKRIYKIQLDTNILSKEKQDKNIQVYAYPGTSTTPPNDKGWNVIGNPFMDIYKSDLTEPIQIGKLKKDSVNGQWTGKWVLDEESVSKSLRYIVVKNYDKKFADANYYETVLLTDGYNLKPFTSFFIQVHDTALLTFHKDKKIARMKLSNTNNTSDEIFLRVCVGDKKTGCFISNKFNDTYEICDDIESNESIYQLINGYKLLYSAINDSIIEHGVTVYAPSGNLHLDNKTNVEDFEEINVLYNGGWYNLLHGQTVDVVGEFILQAKRKTHNVATGLDEVKVGGEFDKYIHNGKVYIRKNNCIFTVLGEIVK